MLPTQMSETEETIQNQSLKDDELALIDLKAILEWLATPAARHPEDELAPLHAHLTALRETATAAHQRHKVLDLLYTRAHGTVQRLIPDLTGVSLPLSRKTRQTVRGMQDVLLMVAEDYLNTFGDLDAHLIKGLRRPPELTLWRALDALSSHLLISDYSASPAAPGVWSLMHRAYRMANEAGVTEQPARGAGSSPREVYQRALLLASAQPASFTSREIDVVVDYILRFGSRINLIAATEGMTDAGIFHIDPERDLPPVAAARRPPPAGAMCLNCERIAQLAEEQVAALDAGAAPRDIDLPDDFIAPSVQGILRRLALYWGHSGKRRFTRRRQNYRAVLCIGLQALWQLFHDDETQAGELTSWMVTNESPDGYALMHVTGKTNRVTPGDIVALRTENVADWQICIVRWALSENPEHLEIGLQVLATRATPAILACTSRAMNGSGIQQPVLVLPELPPLRPAEMLVAPTGTTHAGAERMVLMIEKENLELREVIATHLDEQTANIEVFAFEPRPLS